MVYKFTRLLIMLSAAARLRPLLQLFSQGDEVILFDPSFETYDTCIRMAGGVPIDGTESLVQVMLHSRKWGTTAFVILEILFWGVVAGFLNMKQLYVKL